MNSINDIFVTIFSTPIYSAVLFVTTLAIIFGYIALTAKVVKDKPRSQKTK